MLGSGVFRLRNFVLGCLLCLYLQLGSCYANFFNDHAMKVTNKLFDPTPSSTLRASQEDAMVVRAERIVPSKWIFSYANTQNTPEERQAYDEMVKVAVISARTNTYLDPICIYYGSDSSMTAWLLESGVKVIKHTPLWADAIKSMFRENPTLMQELQQVSPLYSSPEQVIAAMQRVDIPTLPLNDGYVLYTDVDVIFAGPIDWESFGETPDFFTVGAAFLDNEKQPTGDKKKSPPWSAAVMLLNIDNLKTTYDDFIAHTFSEKALKQGLRFEKDGNLAVGAYSSFYHKQYDIVQKPKFNWKAYWPQTAPVSIIHFEGPKPYHYRELQKGHTLSPNLAHYVVGQDCHVRENRSGCMRAMNLFNMYSKIGKRGAFKEDKFWLEGSVTPTHDLTPLSIFPTLATVLGVVGLCGIVVYRRHWFKLMRHSPTSASQPA